ncbi:M23 family metallopeptidase [Gracilinema caldarium]|nr:M23 family metallopeptidase [Gracilinema caldarium]
MNIQRMVILQLAFFVSWFFPLCSLGAETIHVVQKGETLYSIAKQYNCTYKELLEYNNITNASKIFVGQKIKIPESSDTQMYIVKRGDTLFSIARTFSVSIDGIRKINGLTEKSIIKEGMSLKIPNGVKPVEMKQDTIQVRSMSETPIHTNTEWPVQAKSISYLTGKLYGVVILTEADNIVRSLTSGTVVSAGPYRGFGKVAIVQGANGYLYVYGGCEILNVREGDSITSGTILGRIGIDSISKQPQLYFLVYKDNKPIDPVLAPRG